MLLFSSFFDCGIFKSVRTGHPQLRRIHLQLHSEISSTSSHPPGCACALSSTKCLFTRLPFLRGGISRQQSWLCFCFDKNVPLFRLEVWLAQQPLGPPNVITLLFLVAWKLSVSLTSYISLSVSHLGQSNCSSLARLKWLAKELHCSSLLLLRQMMVCLQSCSLSRAHFLWHCFGAFV